MRRVDALDGGGGLISEKRLGANSLVVDLQKPSLETMQGFYLYAIVA